MGLAFKLKPLTISLWLCLATSVRADQDVRQFSPSLAAAQLGWQSDPNANACGGRYIEPDLGSTDTNLALDMNQPLNIDAAASDLQNEGISTLSGGVTMTQPGRFIRADTVQLLRNANRKTLEQINLQGYVVMREPSKITVGNSATLNVTDNTADYYHVLYRMGLNFQPIYFTPASQHSCSVHGIIAQGSASEFNQVAKGLFHLIDASYSTCAPLSSSWHLKAKTIDLNHQSGRGVAHSATLYVKNIPVFYSPYFNFPLDKRRMTGFLMPSYGHTTNGGWFLSAPFYWNIAPSTDMTLTPNLYTKRGVQLATDNRYLTTSSSGTFKTAMLPDDQAFSSFQKSAPAEYPASQYPSLPRLLSDSNDRWFYNWKDTTVFDTHWRGGVDITQVSDDYYQEDFNLPSATAAQLLQQAHLDYSAAHWNSILLVQNYQTLHPVNLLTTSNQYARLPDFSFNANYPGEDSFDYNLAGQAVYFSRLLNPGEIYPSDSGNPTSGVRSNLQPGISLPMLSPSGYLKPTLQYQATQYSLEDQTTGYNSNIYRGLPIFNIDAGLYFDRNISLFNNDYQQTLEPRAYYLYVPYQDQYQIPVFDTSEAPFTYDQMFVTNRFAGIDRVGDANQITLALSTRFLDSNTGVEKAKFALGRIFYAENRQVMLCTTPGCTDSQYTIGYTSPTESASPIAGLASYNINKNWAANANIAWDPATHQTENGSLVAQYKPAINHIINVSYNFIRYGDPNNPPSTDPTASSNNLNQIGTSFVWPIHDAWDVLASWNYNLSHDHFQTFLYGVTYNACCYAVRLAVGKTFTDLNGDGSANFNQQIYLQVILKGMGGVGTTNALSTLGTNIPGYQDKFMKANY